MTSFLLWLAALFGGDVLFVIVMWLVGLTSSEASGVMR